MAAGSGFVISADGYIVTNNHVVDNATKVTVVFDNGDEVAGQVVGTDERTDLAVVKIDGGTDLPFVKLSDTEARVGDWVVAVGNPFGLGGTVTAGIISARGRDIAGSAYGDFLQIDAAVNTGNSGGPAFNLKGEVVGVNTAIFSPNGGNVGIAFAIPAGVVKQVTDAADRERHRHPRLPRRRHPGRHPRHRRQRWPRRCPRRARHRADQGQPGRQGRRQVGRHHHRGRRQARSTTRSI